MKKFLKLILVVILLSGFIIFLQAVNINAEQFSPWAIDKLTGTKAPDFTLKDISGKDISLSSFKGRPVLLNFWATWCPYCREERPLLNSLYKEYKNKGLIIVAVSTDKSAQKVKDYLKKIPMEFTLLIDNRKTAELYGVYALPTSFLLNRDGVIKQKFMGVRDWTDQASKKLIDELLK
ncbi:MAG: TlpA family protein disulfide reductase [Nitrospirae bacterium]|nr:TlpA family protein disulfide reductase [Nitrospirota bacterium]